LWYNEFGNLEAKENYINGLLSGDFEEYFPNGKLKTKSSFAFGLPNGWSVVYREDGSKQIEGNSKLGKKVGEWKEYDDNGTLVSTHIYQIDFDIKEAKMSLKLPNNEWYLASKSNEGLIQYIFKRNEILDSMGRSIIPAIMFYIDDVSAYNQNLEEYSNDKRMLFKYININVNKVLTPANKDYPLPYKNSKIFLTTYSDKGFNHIMYMIYIITNDNKGIQLYMDMTEDLAGEYEKEFWTTLRSIKELK